MSYVLKADWQWSIDHADPNEVDGVNRWKCKAHGTRMHAESVRALVKDSEGTTVANHIVVPICKSCIEFMLSINSKPTDIFLTSDLVEVEEVK